MERIWIDILRGIVILFGGCAAVVGLVLIWKRIVNREIWKRNERISQLTRKYNQGKSTSEEDGELKSLHGSGLVSRSFFVREGKFCLRYDLSERAFDQSLARKGE